MTLSIIIVSYNVKFFLEQCLCSVQKAIAFDDQLPGDAEIFVVDNHSDDGSMTYLPPQFPGIKFLVNTENTGFARANNQALLQAKGKYVLFLNPDTIIAEDSLTHCISFLESHPQAGAAGVRMIDGNGIFLKESKRGFPFPGAAFCRLSGLSALFPRSKLFAAYYLGHLPEHQNNPVEVLSGAFMLLRKETLDKTGGFDERFFMYAEDIDLSYRVRMAGYCNYYIADTTIIHFKGESTTKDPRYTRMFYKAMDQFIQKHSDKAGPTLFLSFMKPALWLRSKMASAALLFSGRTGKGRTHKTVLMGDPDTVGRLKTLLAPAAGRTIVQESREANETILCEGNAFHFKQIIACIQEEGDQTSFKIHAAGSHSVVGSDSKDRKGETIAL